MDFVRTLKALADPLRLRVLAAVCEEELTVGEVQEVVESVQSSVSRNLASLPAICFEPPSPSAYRIRRQPKPHCYSTLEAIHHVLDLFSPRGNEASRSHRPHENLLTVFNSVIDRQLAYTR